MDTNSKLSSIRFISLFVFSMLVNILSQAVHETGHHLVYQMLGHEPVWAFTKVVQMSETTPSNPANWVENINPDGSSNWLKVSSMPTSQVEKAISSAAGPLLGLLSATFGLVMSSRRLKVTSQQAWLAYVISISLVAVIYYIRAPMRTGGDEYDVAMSLGIARSLVEIPLALGYLACLVLGVRELSTWRVRFTWLGTILLGSIATGLPMALLDTIIIAQVDEGNMWFQPVIGYSLPVFVTIVLTFSGIWVWAYWQERLSK